MRHRGKRYGQVLQRLRHASAAHQRIERAGPAGRAAAPVCADPPSGPGGGGLRADAGAPSAARVRCARNGALPDGSRDRAGSELLRPGAPHRARPDAVLERRLRRRRAAAGYAPPGAAGPTERRLSVRRRGAYGSRQQPPPATARRRRRSPVTVRRLRSRSRRTPRRLPRSARRPSSNTARPRRSRALTPRPRKPRPTRRRRKPDTGPRPPPRRFRTNRAAMQPLPRSCGAFSWPTAATPAETSGR